MRFFTTSAAMVALLAAMSALAHNPNQSNIRVAHCWAEHTEVVCRSTRALAGSWNHVPVQVFDAVGEVLHHEDRWPGSGPLRAPDRRVPCADRRQAR